MPQSVTRPNRVLKNISKDQDLFHAIREFCTLLTQGQGRCKIEIAKFKEISGNLLVTKKLQTSIPIVIRVIVLRKDTVTENVVDRCSKSKKHLAPAHETAAGERMQGPPEAQVPQQKPPQRLTTQLPEIADLSAVRCLPLHREHP